MVNVCLEEQRMKRRNCGKPPCRPVQYCQLKTWSWFSSVAETAGETNQLLFEEKQWTDISFFSAWFSRHSWSHLIIPHSVNVCKAQFFHWLLFLSASCVLFSFDWMFLSKLQRRNRSCSYTFFLSQTFSFFIPYFPTIYVLSFLTSHLTLPGSGFLSLLF